MLFLGLAIVCFGSMGSSECENTPDSREVEAARQEKIMVQANAQVGMPNIVRFQEKKTMKTIMELRDQADVINNAYLQSQLSGKLIYIGKCLGFPLPYATQFTNPEMIGYISSYGVCSLPQADPNGLFMPSSAAGTWVMMINPKTNQPGVCYFEQDVAVSPVDIRLDLAGN